MAEVLDHFIRQAKSDLKTIVLPESYAERTIRAASDLARDEVVRVILLGNEDKIRTINGGRAVPGVRIIEPARFERFREYADILYECRKSKGVTPEQAEQLLLDPLYFGVMLVHTGEADGMVAGATHSTADTLRPALQIIRSEPEKSLVSGFFIIIVPDCAFGYNGVFLFADSGLVEDPDEEELAEIAVRTARSFRKLFNAEPKVALLSYSTYGSSKGPLVDKMTRATALAKLKAPDLSIDGELQLDAALIKSIGSSKAPNSPVAGQANVLIFPDLNSGNITYKAVERFAGAKAIGLITQGLRKPVNDMSRGCSADDIYYVAAITAIQAQKAL